MRKTFLPIAALTLLIAITPALAQEAPSTSPAPSTEQPAPAETDANKEAPKDASRKAEPAHARRITHHRYGWYVWPWTWVWYQLRYPFYHHHHRA